MGFPAQNIEGVYRNHIDDVVRFFDTRHKGHYKIYNLCKERQYDATRFQDRVANFPFDDHNPPKLLNIKPFCEDVEIWLSKDKQNIAAIHCKAGKGRTGLMIAAYLLHTKLMANPRDALEFFGQQRTSNSKGVTIPSQRRYVEYYGELVKTNFHYEFVTLEVKSIHFEPIPNYTSGVSLQFSIHDHEKKIHQSSTIEIKKGEKCFHIDCSSSRIRVCDDVRFDFLNSKIIKNERMFSFWFNTYFIKPESTLKNSLTTASITYSSSSSSSNSSSSSLNSSTVPHNNNNNNNSKNNNIQRDLTTQNTISSIKDGEKTQKSINSISANNTSLFLSPSLMHPKNVSPKMNNIAIRLNGESRNSFNGNTLIPSRTSVFNDYNTTLTPEKFAVKSRERYKSGPAQMDQIYNSDIKYAGLSHTYLSTNSLIASLSLD